MVLLRILSTLRWAIGFSFFTWWACTTLVLSLFGGPRRLFRWSQWGFRSLLRIIGLRVEVKGLDNVQPGVGYLYMVNHLTFLDHFVLVGNVPDFILGLEKVENLKIPVYGTMTKWWGNVAIDRSDREGSIRMIEGCKHHLAEGTSFGVAPEGTRSRDGLVGPFKKGVFHMARDMGAPIVPVSLIGMRERNPDRKFLFSPGPVQMQVHPPIPSDRDEPLDALVAAVREQMCSVDGVDARPLPVEPMAAVGGS